MKQMFFVSAVALLAASNNWSFLDLESSDPNVRMEQLLNQSEGSGQIHGEWIRGANLIKDSPSHLTPIRVHGGIGP